MRWIKLDANGVPIQGTEWAGMPMLAATMESAGYSAWEGDFPWETPPAKRYDQLKIIRALGDGWTAKRDELETAGLLDQFYTAPYLSTADDVFAPIFSALTDDQKSMLDAQCQWGV